jgi:hypothetical protein
MGKSFDMNIANFVLLVVVLILVIVCCVKKPTEGFAFENNKHFPCGDDDKSKPWCTDKCYWWGPDQNKDGMCKFRCKGASPTGGEGKGWGKHFCDKNAKGHNKNDGCHGGLGVLSSRSSGAGRMKKECEEAAFWDEYKNRCEALSPDFLQPTLQIRLG